MGIDSMEGVPGIIPPVKAAYPHAHADRWAQKLDADEPIPVNRYFEGSPVYSQRRVPAGTFASAIANADGQASLFQPASTVQ